MSEQKSSSNEGEVVVVAWVIILGFLMEFLLFIIFQS